MTSPAPAVSLVAPGETMAFAQVPSPWEARPKQQTKPRLEATGRLRNRWQGHCCSVPITPPTLSTQPTPRHPQPTWSSAVVPPELGCDGTVMLWDQPRSVPLLSLGPSRTHGCHRVGCVWSLQPSKGCGCPLGISGGVSCGFGDMGGGHTEEGTRAGSGTWVTHGTWVTWGKQGQGVTERCRNRSRIRSDRREVTQGQDLGVTKQEIEG